MRFETDKDAPGAVWRRRRLSVGMSLGELSRRTRINRGFLSRYESGSMIVPEEHFDRVMAEIQAEEAKHMTEATLFRAYGVDETPPPEHNFEPGAETWPGSESCALCGTPH